MSTNGHGSGSRLAARARVNIWRRKIPHLGSLPFQPVLRAVCLTDRSAGVLLRLARLPAICLSIQS